MRDRHLWEVGAQVPELEAGSRLKAQGSRDMPSAFNLEPSASLWFSEKDQAHVEGLWKRWGLEAARRLILIAPGARSHIKRWTTEGFARVADRLISEAGAHIIFSGESDEEPIVEEIRGLMRHTSHSAVGLVTIRQLGVLMARAQLVITNDSAALHMASALNVPTVAIFGPTDAAKYGPTADARRVIRRRLFCSPCEQSLCRFHHECMRFISPDDVVDAAMQLLIADAHSQTHSRHPA
jgi:heptosyltransferase-2